MPLARPHPKIYRPGPPAQFLDAGESVEARDYRAAFDVINRDLRRLFEFVEPSPANAGAYSHRTFELLLRTCTEIESNFKAIASGNGHDWDRENILRYSDLEGAMRLSEYDVRCMESTLGSFRPFASFVALDRQQRSPDWYRAYNAAKHHRAANFHEASLEHVVHAVGGLFVLLFAQYGPSPAPLAIQGGMHRAIRDMFGLYSTPQWTEAESYGFDWHTLKGTADPFENHPLPKRP